MCQVSESRLSASFKGYTVYGPPRNVAVLCTLQTPWIHKSLLHSRLMNLFTDKSVVCYFDCILTIKFAFSQRAQLVTS